MHNFSEGRSEWAGFDTVKPVNVIIGRNNTGKSHLLDLAEALCEPKLYRKGWQYKCRGTLDEGLLKREFPENVGSVDLAGNHWRDNGRHFVGIPITWEIDEQSNCKDLALPESFNAFPPNNPIRKGHFRRLETIATQASHKLTDCVFHRLLAERDIRPEKPGTKLALGQDGHGATNIIRRYIHTSNNVEHRLSS